MLGLRNLNVKWAVLFVLITIGCTTASSQRPLSKTELTVEPSEPTTLKTHTAKQISTKAAEYSAQKKYEEAKKEFEKALMANPYLTYADEGLKLIEDVNQEKIKTDTAIHFYKGLAYYIKRHWDEAITKFNKAIEKNGKNGGYEY